MLLGKELIEKYKNLPEGMREDDKARACGFVDNKGRARVEDMYSALMAARKDNIKKGLRKLDEFVKEIERREAKSNSLEPIEMVLKEEINESQLLQENTVYRDLEDCQLELSRCNQAIKLNPDNADAYILRGNLYSNLKDYQAALADYDRAIKLEPDNADAYNFRGNFYSDLEDYQAAIADYDRAIKINFDHAYIYNNRGNVNQQLENYEAALADYNQAIKLNSDDAYSYHFRGTLYCHLGDYKEAIADYSQAIKLKPNYASAYFNRGIVYKKIGSYEAALADYNQAVKLDSKYANVHFNPENSSYLEHSQAELDDFIDQCNNPETAEDYCDRGEIYRDLGDYQAALADYNQAIKLEPDNALAYNGRGIVYDCLENKKAALADYDRAIKLKPNYTDAYFNRGAVCGYLGNYQAALADFNQAIKLKPNYGDAYFNRGIVHEYLGKKQAALADYNQVIKLNPNNALAYNSRGIIYRRLGNKQTALADYNQALKLKSDYADAYYNRANLYRDLGNKQSALSDYEKARELYQSEGMIKERNDTVKEINKIVRQQNANSTREKVNKNLGDAPPSASNLQKASVQDADEYKQQAISKAKEGRYQEAIADFTKALEINPCSGEIFRYRGVACSRIGNMRGAIADLQKAAELYRKQGNLNAQKQLLDEITKWRSKINNPLPRYVARHVYIGEQRWHLNPNDELLPGVTTILAATKPEAEREIVVVSRRQIIHEETDEVAIEQDYALGRGSELHAQVERFLQGFEVTPTQRTANFWRHIHPFLEQRIHNVRLLEGQVWHPKGYAGSVDALADYQGRLTAIDWKTSSYDKQGSWLAEYRLQLTAYAGACNHVYQEVGIKIVDAAVVVVTPTGVQVFTMDKMALREHWQMWMARCEEFYKMVRFED